MGYDVKIRIREDKRCPHCGGELLGDVIEELDLHGSKCKELVELVGYTDADYGNYKELTTDQMVKVTLQLNHPTWNANREAGRIALAALAGNHVEFEADW